MGNGDSVRESNERKGAMVYSPAVYDVPLLPYEKQLVRTLGCTEEEYKLFAAEVRKKGRLRPAEYEHIPDVQCEAATIILVNLAVSLLLTGVAYLLTPKPRQPSAPKQIGRRDLGSIVGADRFVSSTGFDSTAELADYDAPIPIIFALYDETTEAGGVLVSPKLVWSRMFSQGLQQTAKLMFVVGERGLFQNGFAGIPRPEEDSFFLGNNKIDPVFSQLYTIYWNRNTGGDPSGRIKKGNLAFPEELRDAPGELYNPDNDLVNGVTRDDIFSCPDLEGEDESTDFCQSLSPSNSTQFGMYAPIKNGTPYRPNWRVISIPKIEDANRDKGRRQTRERRKIAGDIRRDGNKFKVVSTEDLLKRDGMSGTGRNYCTFMGLTRINTNSGIETVTNNDFTRTISDVRVGDTATFVISNRSLPEDLLGKEKGKNGYVSVEDINQALFSHRVAADNVLRIGEIFAIGATTWQVTKRRVALFSNGVEFRKQEIDLKCIDVSRGQDHGPRKIGLVNEKAVVNGKGTLPADGSDIQLDGFLGDEDPPSHMPDTAYFPLMRVTTGTFTNTRKCHTTEIGIKSTVFQRLNGLTSFVSIPTPAELDEADEERITITGGTISSYVERASAFHVLIRRKGNPNFKAISDMPFVVIGNNPTPVFNSISVRHGEGRFDFKFVPISGAELGLMGDSTPFVRLDANLSNTAKDKPSVVSGGRENIRFEAVGQIVSLSSFRANKELISNAREFFKEGSGDLIPSAVKASATRPNVASLRSNKVTGVRLRGLYSEARFAEPDNQARGINGALLNEIFGIANTMEPDQTVRVFEYYPASDGELRWVQLEYKADPYVYDFPGVENNWAYQNGIRRNWTQNFTELKVISSSNNWSGDIQNVQIKRGEEDTSDKENNPTPGFSQNPFVLNNPRTINQVGLRLKFTKEASDRREDIKQAYRHQVFGNPYGGRAIKSFVTETVTLSKGNKQIKLELKAQILFSQDYGRRVYDTPTVEVVTNQTDAGWKVGDKVTHELTVSSSTDADLFYIKGKKVSKEYEITSLAQEVAPVVVTSGDRLFEDQTQYSDVTFYDGLIDKSNASQPEHEIVYVNEIATNKQTPEYTNLVTAGLVVKADRNFNRLDQLRVWLGKGLRVERLNPNISQYQDGADTYGASNLFSDLAYFLLTNKRAGVGGAIGDQLVDKNSFINTAKFLATNELFFNGAISSKVNLQSYLTETAPFFLCNFLIKNGKYALQPALPNIKDDGTIDAVSRVEIKQIFTAGNILEDSFELEYLRQEERQAFTAFVKFRLETKNSFPEDKVIRIQRSTNGRDLQAFPDDTLAKETFDLSQFCTTERHAITAGKYFLALRELVTHTIKFTTTLSGLSLEAGDYIKVFTESMPFDIAKNGTVSSSGVVTSTSSIPDGDYVIDYFFTGTDVENVNEAGLRRATIRIANKAVADPNFHGIIFSIANDTTISQNTYLVEQLTMADDGTVQIVASEHPCDVRGASRMNALIVSDSSFVLDRL